VADRRCVEPPKMLQINLGERPCRHRCLPHSDLPSLVSPRISGTTSRGTTQMHMPPFRSEPGIARGGKAVYGAPLGILMLDARFPRIPGDMGNATTWPFPVLYRVVKGATPERVVLNAAAGLLEDFL